jgi:hypothetical protein
MNYHSAFQKNSPSLHESAYRSRSTDGSRLAELDQLSRQLIMLPLQSFGVSARTDPTPPLSEAESGIIAIYRPTWIGALRVSLLSPEYAHPLQNSSQLTRRMYRSSSRLDFGRIDGRPLANAGVELRSANHIYQWIAWPLSALWLADGHSLHRPFSRLC